MVDPDSGKSISGRKQVEETLKEQVPIVRTEKGPSQVLNAAPGEVQTKIDSIGADDTGIVRLESQAIYTPTSTWEVKEGVILDYNGARIRPTSGDDLHHIYPGGQVRNPIVNYSGISYSGRVFVLDTTFSGDYNSTQHPRRPVVSGYTIGNYPETTSDVVFSLKTSDNRPDADITGLHIADGHDTADVGTVYNLNSESGNLDHNRFTGQHNRHRIGIHTHGVGTVTGNRFECFFGPTGRIGEERLWLLESGNSNVFVGYCSNPQDYEPLWEISSTAGKKNKIKSSVKIQEAHIVDQLGDPSNCVVSVSNTLISDISGKNFALGDEGTEASGGNTTAIGGDAKSTTQYSTVMGWAAKATNNERATALGSFSKAEGYGSIAIGNDASATADRSGAFGENTSVDTPNVARFGGQFKQLVFQAAAEVLSENQMRSSEVKFEIDEKSDQLDVIVKYSDGETVKNGTIDLS